ncbi:hypothetical protein C0585_01830 [Candidatus Woesearchaeota archaeon]|nr:MAG: hypothetical protein C0585_01830 [Candidatus Woesearchaeota archaeon]
MDKNKKKFIIIGVLYLIVVICLFAVYQFVNNYGIDQKINKETITTGWWLWKDTTVKTTVEVVYNWYLIIGILILGILITVFLVKIMKKNLMLRLLNKKE